MPNQFSAALILTFGSLFALPPPSRQIVPPALISPVEYAILDNGCQDKTDGIEWDFQWTNVPGARLYHLYVIGPQAKYPVINDAEIEFAAYQRTSPQSYIIERNRRGWRWKVRALVGKHEWSEWSEERTFDVEPLNTDCP